LKEEDERAEDAVLSLGGARQKGRKEKERLHGPSFQGPYPLHFSPREFSGFTDLLGLLKKLKTHHCICWAFINKP
jgi:hypothetical protein